MRKVLFVFSLLGLPLLPILASPEPSAQVRLTNYFAHETALLSNRTLEGIHSWHDYLQHRPEWRAQLREMLSLDPLPARTDLHAEVTGSLEEIGFSVEKVVFQSWPGLYVTANLYLPKPRLTTPAPTILYLCGHGRVAEDGVSFGNKVAYQHHGAWFAQHGYVCLLIDTLQLGEIEGLHHGTYREGMWWWNSRGYTPAGVEAWNSIRALDYLSTRPEVDTNRFGVTGRSGGGAYSWWVAALDDRIRVAAPVAGITDLQNHVVDGAVEGHCDCMFLVNTYRWDYARVASLVAPRPLLLVNTDHDSIFPLDGVLRVYGDLRRLYGLASAEDELGLVIGPGPHKDTQDLQMPVFRWFNKHLKNEDPIIEQPALKFSEPAPLKVLATIPSDQKNTTIQEIFVPVRTADDAPLPGSWQTQREQWMQELRARVFGGWPTQTIDHSSTADQAEETTTIVARDADLELREVHFLTQHDVRLPVLLFQSNRAAPAGLRLNIVDTAGWEAALAALRSNARFAERFGSATTANPAHAAAALQHFQELQRQAAQGWAIGWFAPRGFGEDDWRVEAKKLVQIRRRFMLLGQTLDSMRVWDIREAIRKFKGLNIHLYAQGDLACDSLYAALFEPELAGIHLSELPASHMKGPDYLNVLRVLDIPQTVAMVAEKVPVELTQVKKDDLTYPRKVAATLAWPADRLRISDPAP